MKIFVADGAIGTAVDMRLEVYDDPLAGGHAGESPYRHDPAARLSLTMGYARDPLHDSRYPWWLPPRDRCAWSPEIARKRTRELERDRQVQQMRDPIARMIWQK